METKDNNMRFVWLVAYIYIYIYIYPNCRYEAPNGPQRNQDTVARSQRQALEECSIFRKSRYHVVSHDLTIIIAALNMLFSAFTRILWFNYDSFYKNV